MDHHLKVWIILISKILTTNVNHLSTFPSSHFYVLLHVHYFGTVLLVFFKAPLRMLLRMKRKSVYLKKTTLSPKMNFLWREASLQNLNLGIWAVKKWNTFVIKVISVCNSWVKDHLCWVAFLRNTAQKCLPGHNQMHQVLAKSSVREIIATSITRKTACYSHLQGASMQSFQQLSL